MAILTCPVVMHEHRYGSNDPVIDTNEYVTFRWSCPDCDQRSFATFATPAEAEHYLTSHLGRYCKGVDHREAL